MRNRVLVECKTLRYIGLINAIRGSGINIQNISVDTELITFVVQYRDYKQVEEIAKGIGYEVGIVQYYGIRSLWVRGMRNIGLIIGIAIGISCSILMSQLLMVVDVHCDVPSYKFEVEKLLKDNYIRPICFKKSINTDKVETLILGSVEEATFVSVYKQGFSLQVQVISRDKPIEAEKSSSLTATHDGVITRIVLSSGTAKVKVNDSVHKGQELVAGQFNLLDTAGQPTGQTVPCEAKAEVYAKVYYSGQFYLPSYVMENEKSNEPVVLKEFYLGKTLIGKKHLVPFERYELVVGEVKMDGMLPFTVKTYTYYNITEKRVEKEEYRERVMYRFREEVLNSMPIGSVVLNSWTEMTTLNGLEILNIHYEVEQRIDIST